MSDQKRNYIYASLDAPRTHSYGFAQCYLNGRDDVRLHLFDQAICVQACIPEQIPIRHNHRYDFRSTVLKGIVVDKPCFILRCGDCDLGQPPWTLHEVRPMHEEQARTKGHGELWSEGAVKPTEAKVYVVEGTPRVIREGESYEMTTDQFHETQHIGPTLSLFKRHNVGTGWSKLIVPPGYTAEHSIAKVPHPDWLKLKYWEQIKTLQEPALDAIIAEMRRG